MQVCINIENTLITLPLAFIGPSCSSNKAKYAGMHTAILNCILFECIPATNHDQHTCIPSKSVLKEGIQTVSMQVGTSSPISILAYSPTSILSLSRRCILYSLKYCIPAYFQNKLGAYFLTCILFESMQRQSLFGVSRSYKNIVCRYALANAP